MPVNASLVPMILSGKKIAVLGLGASGRGAARLAQRYGAIVTGYDSGSEAKLASTVAAWQQEGRAVRLAPRLLPGETYDLAVLSPGIDPSWELPQSFRSAGIDLIGELEFGWAHAPQVPVVAITGTNGKSTTTELVACFLRAGGFRTQPSGNHGRALSDVLAAEEVMDIHTVEVSSFQLESIRHFRPRVAVWTNFAPDHLDRYPDEEAYFAAKQRLFENQSASDVAVVKLEDRRPSALKARVITFSAYSRGGDYELDGFWIRYCGERVFDFSATRLRGLHNAENVMAALAAAREFGVEWDVMQEAARTYQPPRHRCELVAVVEGREYVNDSKATNLHALESCLRALPGPLVLIAGGKDKGLDFSSLAPLVGAKVSQVLVIGQLRPHLSQAWGQTVPVEACASLEEAVERAHVLSHPGQLVVLSPGTSSFDMFSGYEERGEVFVKAVERLNAGSATPPPAQFSSDTTPPTL